MPYQVQTIGSDTYWFTYVELTRIPHTFGSCAIKISFPNGFRKQRRTAAPFRLLTAHNLSAFAVSIILCTVKSMKMILSCFLTIAVCFNYASASEVICPALVQAGSRCPGGCWNESGNTNINGSRECVIVGAGYYSAHSDNRRFPCPAGSFTSVEGDSTCHSCPSGSFSELGSTFCIPCDTTYYDGEGANSMQVWQGVSYCTRITSTPIMTISSSPSSAPTISDSSTPTDSSQTPSTQSSETNIVNITSPEALSFEKDAACPKGSMIWHGQCQQCPSKTQSIAGPIALALILSIVVVLVHHLPENCITGLWMGLEYMQLLYLMALIPFPNTKAFQVLVSIVSTFALDTDATFSLQCMHGISQQADQALILMLPLIIGPILWIVQKIHKELPDITGGICVVFYLGHTKLLLTSIEAMRCSPSSWFCSEKKLVAILGILGLVMYGLILPFLLVRSLRIADLESQQSFANSWKRRFPYQPGCWKWTAFLMARKTILIAILVASMEKSYLTLAFFLITLLSSEIVQRFCLPHPEDNKSAPWLQNTQAAVVFQASLLILGALSFAFWTSTSKPSSSGLAITVTFFVIVIPSVLYWILVLTRSYSFRHSGPSTKPKPPSLPPSQSTNLSGESATPTPSNNELQEQESLSSDMHLNRLHSDFGEPLKRCSPAKIDKTAEDRLEDIDLDEGWAMPSDYDSSDDTSSTTSIPMGHECPIPAATAHPDCVAMVLDFWQRLDPRILALPEPAETEQP